jgi:hypothetical protein
VRTRVVVALSLIVLGAGVATGAAQAAAPRILIVSGSPLPRQVVISNWNSIFRVVEQLAANGRPAPRSQLAGRPRLRVSMFWGPQWNDYLRSGHSPALLRPRQADQHGSFYPAYRGRPAVIDLPWAGAWPRIVPASGLAILVRYRVPVRLS